jgi:hypothetical protein
MKIKGVTQSYSCLRHCGKLWVWFLALQKEEMKTKPKKDVIKKQT